MWLTLKIKFIYSWLLGRLFCRQAETYGSARLHASDVFYVSFGDSKSGLVLTVH